MAALYTYFIKLVSRLYGYYTTVFYYLFLCSVRENEIEKILSTSNEEIIIQKRINLTATNNQNLASVPGTIHWWSSKLKEKKSGRVLPFEQSYRLYILNRTLAKEQQQLQQAINLLIQKKKRLVSNGIRNFIRIDHLINFLTEETLRFAYLSEIACVKYFLKQHYPTLIKLMGFSYNYTPLYYLFLSSLLASDSHQFLRLIVGYSAIRKLKKCQSGLNNNHLNKRSKEMKHLGKKFNSLSLCSYLNDSIAVIGEKRKFWKKSLIPQNSTAFRLTILNLGFVFYPSSKNQTEKSFLLPSTELLSLDGEEILPFNSANFCKQTLFSHELLTSSIHEYSSIEPRCNVTDSQVNIYRQAQNNFTYSFGLNCFTFTLLLVGDYREYRTHQNRYNHELIWVWQTFNAILAMLLSFYFSFRQFT